MGVVRRNAYEKEPDSTIEKIYSFIRVLFRSVLLSRNREEKSIDSTKSEKQRTRIERREIDGQIQVWEQISRFKKGVVTGNLAIGEEIMQPQFREGKKIQHG